MHAKLLICACVTSLVAVMVAQSVSAKSPNKPVLGFGKIYSAAGQAPGEPASVKAQERTNLKRYLGDRTLTTAAKSCNPKPFYEVYTFKNALHTTVLWQYYEQVYYCTSGLLVTYFYRYRWASMSSIVPVVDWNPWSFDGNVNSGSDCANEHCFIRNFKSPSRTAVTKGSFTVCAAKIIGWCNHIYPTISITVYGDGSSPSASATG